MSILVFLLLSVAAVLPIAQLPSKKTLISFQKNETKEKRIQINPMMELTWWEKLWIQTDATLKKIEKPWSFFYKLASICFVAGFVLGCIMLHTIVLSIVIGIACMPLSYLYLLMRSMNAKRTEIEDLENTMTIITNAYISNDDILCAFQIYLAEKNRNVDPRFQKITPFDEFVTDILLINPNVERALTILGTKIKNVHFQNWIKYMILCHRNRTLKFALPPIINAMNDEKIMQIESDTAMIAGWRNFLTLAAVVFSIIPLMRIVNKEWFFILTKTFGGQFLIVLMIVVTLITAYRVMRINRPIHML